MDIEYRLAKIEQKIESKIATDIEDKKELQESIDSLAAVLNEIRMERAKEKGFYGGIMFAIGGAASIVTFVLSKYLHIEV